MPEKALTDLPPELRKLYTKGYDAFQRENFDYAIELFTQILTKEPYVLDCRKALRVAQAKKSGNAGGFFKRAFSSATSSPQVAKGQLALRKDPLEAIRIGEEILNADANSSSGHKLIAEAALAADMPQTAVLSLEVLVKNAPTDKSLNMQLADALVAGGEKTRAENVLETLRKSHPNDGEIFQKLKDLSANKTMDESGYGALAGGKGSYRDILKDKAESVQLEQEKRQVKAEDVAEGLMLDYETRLKTDPNNLKLLRNMAELTAQKQQYDRALEFLNRIVALDGGTDASLQKQIADTTTKRFDHALKQLDTNSPEYNDKVAQIKADKQTYQLEECKSRADKYPTDLQIRFELGQLYYEAGKIAEAQPEFQKAQANPHRKLAAMTFLAKCFAARGMNDLAAKRLQDALKEKLVFDEEKKELIYSLGVIYEKMGRKDESIEQFKMIYEIDSAYKDVAKRVEDHYSAGGT
jgi:tetratricopeptide (TPR) repeat protein